jgi:hypothetical protein
MRVALNLPPALESDEGRPFRRFFSSRPIRWACREVYHLGRIIHGRNKRRIQVFRFTIREMLWLTLVVALVTCWFTEGARAKQWRRRAEIAAGQLEAENLGRMVFEEQGVRISDPQKDTQYREVFISTADKP